MEFSSTDFLFPSKIRFFRSDIFVIDSYLLYNTFLINSQRKYFIELTNQVFSILLS